jgi:hypothetical protein
MSRIISIHEYSLKPDVDKKVFENAVLRAHESGLFDFPGLEGYRFVKGIKGYRSGRYATIWRYESREAWEKLWGTLDQPLAREEYPERWKIWENKVLKPFLKQDPDAINYTAYEEL